MSYIIGVTKPGIDIFEADNVDDFQFHSNYDTLKYETQGLVTAHINQANYYASDPGSPPFIPATYSHYNITEVEHNLEYYPDFIGYGEFVNGRMNQLPVNFATGSVFIFWGVYADNNKLYFVTHFNSTANSGILSVNYGYRIYKNDLGL